VVWRRAAPRAGCAEEASSFRKVIGSATFLFEAASTLNLEVAVLLVAAGVDAAAYPV